MKTLFLIGSPYFDGAGIIYDEILRTFDRGDEINVLDVISPFKYPAIKNFNYISYLLWLMWRKHQFRSGAGKAIAHWYSYSDILYNGEVFASDNDCELAKIIITDDGVCKGLIDDELNLYVKKRLGTTIRQVSTIRQGLIHFINANNYQRIVVFNGRNAISRIIKEIAEERNISFFMLEYTGSKGDEITYICSPVDLFDFDSRSEYILAEYEKSPSPEREMIAEEVLNHRSTKLEPLSRTWNMLIDNQLGIDVSGNKKNVSMFFASEDEYPAFKKSRYGFSDPTRQYLILTELCNRILRENISQDVRIIVKLHPRYYVEKKLKRALDKWLQTFDHCVNSGVDLVVYPAHYQPYNLIRQSDVIFSFGSTAWEATYLGKPAVVLGPNPFTTHGCCYVASSVDEIFYYIVNIPPALDKKNTYPYAWAWDQMGIVPRYFIPLKQANSYLARVDNIISNRFFRVQARRPE